VDGPAGVSAVALLRLPQPVGHSFSRLFTLLRSALWQKLELRSLLERYGQPAAAAASWARRKRPICPVWDEAMGQPNFISQTNHQILKLIFDLVTRFLRKKPCDRHASATCGLPLNPINSFASALSFDFALSASTGERDRG